MGLLQIYWLPEQDGELFDASRVGGQRAEMKSMMFPNVQAASAHSSSNLLLLMFLNFLIIISKCK